VPQGGDDVTRTAPVGAAERKDDCGDLAAMRHDHRAVLGPLNEAVRCDAMYIESINAIETARHRAGDGEIAGARAAVAHYTAAESVMASSAGAAIVVGAGLRGQPGRLVSASGSDVLLRGSLRRPFAQPK